MQNMLLAKAHDSVALLVGNFKQGFLMIHTRWTLRVAAEYRKEHRDDNLCSDFSPGYPTDTKANNFSVLTAGHKQALEERRK